jgi:glyoxylase-like metal-dependent hydrolase (beta-lactamase superfamily II)
MQRERISDDIFVFTSGLYAQVTAGAVLTSEGAVMIDTLPFPSEARQIVEFISKRSDDGIRYVIFTHYHADHTYGAYVFDKAQVISHALCRDWMVKNGRVGLGGAGADARLGRGAAMHPNIVFDGGEMTLRLGGQDASTAPCARHAGLACGSSRKIRSLFAADTVMPVPMWWTAIEALSESLGMIHSLSLENIVQGHGEVILRGEISETLDSSARYLEAIQSKVAKALAAQKPREAMR